MVIFMRYVESEDFSKKDLDNLDFFMLDEKIFVYRGLLPNVKHLVQALKVGESNPDKSWMFKDWHPWGAFGFYISSLGGMPETNEDFASLSLDQQETISRETFYNEEVKKAFAFSTEHWLRSQGGKKEDDWVAHGPSYSRYIDSSDVPKEFKDSYAMEYHTDYVQLRDEEPGDKFVLTCTMYLNDDYEGGEISFIVNDSESVGNTKEIIYKPVEGDVLVFPSGHPEYFSDSGVYMHAVKDITLGTKYLARTFYQKRYPGSKEWHKNLQKYGAEQWFAMEEQRISEGRKTHNDTVYIKNCAV